MPTQFFLIIRGAFSPTISICALTCLAILPAVTLADAGAVRVSKRHGNRQLTVFTEPTPLRAGPVDVSILVQDAVTSEAILEDAIEVEVAPRGFSSTTTSCRATTAAASNKLFQAANVDLPRAGWWQFAVNVEGPQGPAHIQFEVEAGDPIPPWQTLWPWFCWPFLVIVLFAVCKWPRSSN